ncbi:MAG: MBL fold metallo-hydrolase [Muribaculaceae bacterium]|nr:MBL fold metallo-hydrolase [Muribaculaceae bacterium]MDE6093379.1 MBL fold metallo-hydrolase [Muribaculaceae bacterium]
MKLTFLGTGTSCGVPVIGCDCRVCRSSDPRDCRLRTSAVIETEARRILIDCGPDFREQYLRTIRNGSLDGVLLTHVHYDHVGGLDDLRPLTYKNGLTVYCRGDVASQLRCNLSYCFGSGHYPGSPVLNLVEIEDYVMFNAGGVDVLPLGLRHGSLDMVGFRIGDLGYITDASEVPVPTIEALKGVKVLVVNALREREHRSHMNLKSALDVIESVMPERAYLTHMSHEIGLHADISSQLPEGVYAAYDGLTVEV